MDDVAAPAGVRPSPADAEAGAAVGGASGLHTGGTAPAITLPRGGGAIRGIGETFQTNAVTGTASLTVPIAVTPARGDLAPQLALSYDSGSGNGPFGFGWSLSLARIERQTDRGLPRYRDDGDGPVGSSDAFLLSGAEELVPTGEPEPVGEYSVQRYRPRVDTLFARIERWVRTADGDTHWRSITRDDVTHLYGTDAGSRITDPASVGESGESAAGTGPARVFAWLVCESYDDKGNAVVYEYAAEDAAGVDLGRAHEAHRPAANRTVNRYPKRIRYGNAVSRLHPSPPAGSDWRNPDQFHFELVFDYSEGHLRPVDPDPGTPADQQLRRVQAAATADRDGPGVREVRPDAFSSHRAGFEVRTYRRCRRILLFHRFSSLGDEPYLVRSTELDYADLDYSQPTDVESELAHPGSSRFASFVRSITQAGYVRDDDVLPSEVDGVTYVTYVTQALPPLELDYGRARIDDEVREPDPVDLAHLPVGLSGRYRVVDLDGEGIAGILGEHEGAWYYTPNLGRSSDPSDGDDATVRFGPQQVVASRPVLGRLGGDRQLVDLDGDGRLDLLVLDRAAPGFHERTDDGGWTPFRPFPDRPAAGLVGPDVRMVDLDGDGRADVLVTEDEAFACYRSLGEDGFAEPERTRTGWDEVGDPGRGVGPRLVLDDRSDTMYLADMSGDGLVDLVRVRNGEVSYWPSQGYGRFGAKVTMDHAPVFDPHDRFDPRRLLLTDTDGSGPTDLVYLGSDGARLYLNRSGNEWTDARPLLRFPPLDGVSEVTAADLLGRGTGCLVWSTPLPGPAVGHGSGVALRYLDLMADGKPHLLTRVVNNLGSETRVSYRPSTAFYLADRRAGRPWVTRLPFPVQVVERVETHDRINDGRFVTRFAYHHGYFDGVEREFRGFAQVDQWDTAEWAAVDNSATSATAEVDNTSDDEDRSDLDAASNVPPKLTRSWFHTGAWVGRDRISQALAAEYYPGDGDAAALLADTPLPDGEDGLDPLDPEEEREACRALKGSLLREEVYGLDGTPQAVHPYTVTEQNWTIRRIQARSASPSGHAVFVVLARESVRSTYERDPTDPRVSHKLVLAADDFGNERRTAVVAYPRREPDLDLDPREQARQAELRILLTENDLTDPVEDRDAYRAPLPADARTYEVTGVALPSGQRHFTFEDLAGLADPEDPDDLDDDPVGQRQLVGHTRVLYRPDDLTGPLPLGQTGARALPFESYKLAFTPVLVTALYGNRVTDPMLMAAGYRHSQGDADWWVPTGRVFYSPDPGDGAAEELAYAREHFFQPCRYRDPLHRPDFDTETHIAYDEHHLVAVETRDPLGNRVTAGERALAAELNPDQPLARDGIDYRVLKPALMMDANRNCQQVAFDALGLVAATVVMGKPEDSPALGDSMQGVTADLAPAGVMAALADPITEGEGLLGQATTRFVNDVDGYYRTRDDSEPQPPAVLRLARETHVTDLAAGEASALQYLVSYSDGFGREVQRKTRVEAGDDPAGLDVSPTSATAEVPRWVASGWTVFDNKGNPVRQYEPFFSGTHAFEPDVEAGVSPILCYDPLERVVATLHPNHTWDKTVFDAWGGETWDPNDTVLVTDPVTDVDVGGWFRRLPSATYTPTWHGRRIDGGMGDEERGAARRAAVHAGTPSRQVLDSTGRSVMTEAHNALLPEGADPGDPGVLRIEESYATRVRYDASGRPTEVVDARDRVVARADYDLLGNVVRTSSMEGGDRRILDDSAGQPVYTWDGRDRRLRTTCDAIRRPAEVRLLEGAGPEVVVEQTTYGESLSDPQPANLRTRAVEQHDQGGVATTVAYDFEGNLTRGIRSFTSDATVTVDWSGPVALDATVYEHRTRFDAIQRPVELTTPDASRARPTYNQSGLVERIDVAVRGAAPTAFVTEAAYDARGQRTRVRLDNGATTTYEYDAETFRLRRQRTIRPGAGGVSSPVVVLQDRRYTFDPVGNITHVRDHAQQDVFFDNHRVEPRADYTYDAVYQLIEATGREHLAGVAGGVPSSFDDGLRVGLPHPHDGGALGSYRERYRYDPVGNFLELAHRGTDPQAPGWVRTCTYDEPSQLEPAKRSNRLTSSTVGSTITEVYSTGGDGYDADGNQLRMPHLSAMVWDHRDRLRMTERGGNRTWYVYEPDGTRVRKVTVDSAGNLVHERRYLGGFEVYVRTGTNALVRETLHVSEVHSRERALALVETRTDVASPSLVRYQLGDQLDSVAVELGTAGEILSYEEYTPFGSTALQTTTLPPGVAPFPAAKRYRYTGRERDEESGLYHCGQRYYAPWLGRWTSPDPAELRDSVNRYVYVNNRPTGLVDPQGTNGVRPDVLGPVVPGALGPSDSPSLGLVALGAAPSGGSGSGRAKRGSAAKGGGGVGDAIGRFFDGLASGLAKLAETLAESLPGLIAAPIAGLLEIVGGFLRTLGGIFSWKGETVVQGLKETGLGLARIVGVREVFTDGPSAIFQGRGTYSADIEKSRLHSKYVIKDPWVNGHKSWHAGTNALLQQRLGPSPLAIVGLFLGGIYHETFDTRSFSEEQTNQGTVNHIVDSLLDILANVLGQIIGLIAPRQKALEWAAAIGRKLPGPADHDPKHGPGGENYQGNPYDAWSKWKPKKKP